MFAIAGAFVVGYLLGTFPSADLASRLATDGEVDLRQAGSGNPGALNSLKVLGAWWGVFVLVLDVAKGAAAGFIGLALGGAVAGYVGAAAAISGHIFPVWSRFRGGKGVAAAAGACFAVFPAFFLVNLALAALSVIRKDHVALMARLACVAWIACATLWWAAGFSNLWGPAPNEGLVAFSVVGSLLVVSRFRVISPA